MRAVIYARFSTDKQSESSIEDQARNCINYAERGGMTVITRFEDKAISGASKNRPGFESMRAAADRGEFDVLLVDDLSRLSRDDVEMKQVIRRFKFRRIRIVGVSDGYDSDTKGEKIQSTMRGLMNEMYLDDLREKTHRGLYGKAMNGYSAGGRTYTHDNDKISDTYHKAKEEGTLAALPEEIAPHADGIYRLIDSVFSESQLPLPGDDRKPKPNPLNDNFNKKEFQELWARINKRAIYRVEFDSTELVGKCISTLNSELKVSPIQYTIHAGIQGDQITDTQLADGAGFTLKNTETGALNASIPSSVKYDLLGKIAENVHLTRKTLADILGGIEKVVFDQFKQNPEYFIAETSRLINEQKATIIIEKLAYDEVAGTYDASIFTVGQSRQDFTKASEKLKKHIYDYVITDSKNERTFVRELDTSAEVVVYAKLPRGFLIPTPVGDYNPDWAISFTEGKVKYIYFVAESKGSMSSMELREIEKKKIECARKFFEKINVKIEKDKIKYEVISSFHNLIGLIGILGN